MTQTQDFSKEVDALIDDWGSDISFIPITKSTTYGGYSGSETEALASEISTKGISANLISSQFGIQKFGDLSSGSARVVVKSSTNLLIGTEYVATWNGLDWNVVDIQDRGHFQNSTIFKVVTLNKQI